jgi:FMN phosphatase YigB (HAD superfamily)
LRHVRARGLHQGLLSDAQCFTLVQLQRGLAQQDAKATIDCLFNPDVRVLSFEQGGRKPSERLFRQMLQALEKLDIGPAEVLHVGSRIAQDVAPARKLGMRTALFAGDKASLQATAEQLKDPASRPDVLLTDLTQIEQIIAA